MTEKRSRQRLFYFLPLYYLTKGRTGVHILIIPKNNKPQGYSL